MTGFSMHIFMIDLKIPNITYPEVSHFFYRFYLTLWVSMKEFDIIWIILFIFIYYYFYHNYFIDDDWNNIKTVASAIATSMSISLIVGESLSYYKNLNMLFYTPTQIFKCVMVGIGYYLILYIIIRNILKSLKGMKKQ